jgi:phospho-N-acetylmuramoyl-pentapeptide-transferase
MSDIIYSVLLSFFISSIIGWFLIPLLKVFKLGQNIREDGPKAHSKKAGTPSFGGAIFISAAIITMLLFKRQYTREVMLVFYALLAFGLIGFIDDALKKIHKKNEGLKPIQKMLLLLIVSGVLTYHAYVDPSIGSMIVVPFTGMQLNLGLLYIPFIIAYYAITTNAVNFTDGLDGFAASVTLLVMTFFALVSYILNNNSLAFFCGCMAGSLLGFLRYNSYPAKIIMGDTGSLALGGVVATTALVLKNPLIVLIVGGVYAVEAVSVLLQVVSFKLTGRRIFKMAPIHHSFELSGWHESKIVTTFSIITALLCLVAFLSYLKI